MTAPRGRTIVALLGLATALPLAVGFSGASVGRAEASTTTSVSASADTLARSDTPTQNYGHRLHWAVDGRPHVSRRSFLKFEIPAPPPGEEVTRLELSATVQAAGASDGPGPVVHRTRSDWTEADLTWRNQPTLGRVVATTAAPYAEGDVVRWDVTAGLTHDEAASGGTVSFGLDTTERKRLGFESRESGAPARLTVTYGDPSGESSGAVVWAVGDLCDDSPTAACAAVGALIASDREADAVLGLGDLQYDDGTLADFRAYYDPKMGHGPGLFDETLPTPGNHEYHTDAATGYFGYWGSRAGARSEGYYATTVGGWTLVATNSNCSEVRGCQESSPQGRFVADALSSAGSCALVFDHHPAFTDGKYAPGTSEGRKLFDLAYAGGADLFLSGHDHNYQRFAPRNDKGDVAPTTGVRAFVVGTGGESHYGFKKSAREYGNGSVDGALRLTLGKDSYSWQFTTVSGEVLDSGTGSCH